MPTKTETHPADGLYYLSEALLERDAACLPQRNRWSAYYGGARVEITMNVVRVMHAGHNRVVYWAAYMMWMNSKITTEEWSHFEREWCLYNTEERERMAFMDLLATRARREGRL